MADVFLSYASTDVEPTKCVAQILETAGYSVWWDRHLRSGERFQQSIQREPSAASLEQARHIVRTIGARPLQSETENCSPTSQNEPGQDAYVSSVFGSASSAESAAIRLTVSGRSTRSAAARAVSGSPAPIAAVSTR